MTATVNGLDVSAYQTPGAWAGMEPAFVFAKASEGAHTTDAVFAGHIAQAHQRGAVAGAYHFAWPINLVTEDAANFVHAVSGAVSAGRVQLLALDLEPYEDRRNTRGLTPSLIKEWAAEWIRLVKGKFPHLRVGLYADLSTVGAGWVPTTADYYWGAAYPVRGLSYSAAARRDWPTFGSGFPALKFWQFTNTPLDMDLGAFASVDALRAWAGSDAAHAPKPSPKPATGQTYVVRKGDTMSGIAEAHGVSLGALEKANPSVRNPDVIHVGQVLKLPAGAAEKKVTAVNRYTVKWGDTLSGIAQHAGVSLAELEKANPAVRNPSVIYVGQVLTIPRS